MVMNLFDYQDTIIPDLAHILLPLLRTTGNVYSEILWMVKCV